jgi:hypothetical protein
MLPFQRAGYYTAAGEATREAVNTWIRTSGAFDGVIDFDAAMRDPADPLRLNPAYDSGDHLHPDDAGYQAMANAIDLEMLLAQPRAAAPSTATGAGRRGHALGRDTRSVRDNSQGHHGWLLLVKWVSVSMSSALYTWRGGVAKVA